MSYRFRKSQREVEESIETRVQGSVKNIEREILSYNNEIAETGYIFEVNKDFLYEWWEKHYLLCSKYQDMFPEYFRKPPYPRLSPSKKASIATYSLMINRESFIKLLFSLDEVNDNIQISNKKVRDNTNASRIIDNIYAGLVLRTAAGCFGIKHSLLYNATLGATETYNQQLNIFRIMMNEDDYQNSKKWIADKYNEKEHLKYLKAILTQSIPKISSNDSIIVFVELITVLNAYFDSLWCATSNVLERTAPLGRSEEQTVNLHEYTPQYYEKDIEILRISDVVNNQYGLL